MDAEYMEVQREVISRSESRWSMNSQRLEEIIAELMRPIDKSRSFDKDLSALIEEYLTEVGIHALDNAEGDVICPTLNFVELALVLQQSASLYSVRVDFLYQHVLSISISLHRHDNEEDEPTAHDESGERSRRRRRTSTYAVDAEAFTDIELDTSANTTREAEPLRLPPRLPRHYLELDPRPLTDRDAPLSDYAGECVGRFSDFHVAWRLQNGFLVDELEETSVDATSMASLRRPSFSELQAAIQAAATDVVPADPPAISTSSDPIASPSTPFLSPVVFSPVPPEPPPCETPQPLPSSTPLRKHERKRKLGNNEASGEVTINFKLNKRHRRRLLQCSEFDMPEKWRDDVVKSRCQSILHLRRELRDASTTDHKFSGFYDSIHSSDMGSGFRGWCLAEIELANMEAEMMQTMVEGVRAESDDDGFFEQSSLGDCDHSSAPSAACSFPGDANSESWARDVAARAVAAADAGGVDVRAAGAKVLSALRPERPTSFNDVLHNTATTLPDVSHLFLATLFLANEGSVRVVRGAPLALGDFGLQLGGPVPAPLSRPAPAPALAAGT